MKMYDIIAVGSGVVDAFLDTGVSERKKDMCYPVGEKLIVKELSFSTGGGGTNTSASFSKLGLKTGFLGNLGDDGNGKLILSELKAWRISFLGKFGKEPTGFSVVLDSKKHNRTILTFKGANDKLKFSELNLDKLKTKWFYFSAMMDVALETQKKLSKWAFKKGIKVAYNPSSYLTKSGSEHVREILKNCEVVILNEDEAKDLVSGKDLFKGLLKLGPKVACVTYGPKGNGVSNGKNIYFSKPRKVNIAERTGAGDAFASGFVAGLIRGGNIEKAIQIGSLNAESVIQVKGAKNGILSWNGVLKEMKKRPVRIVRG